MRLTEINGKILKEILQRSFNPVAAYHIRCLKINFIYFTEVSSITKLCEFMNEVWRHIINS